MREVAGADVAVVLDAAVVVDPDVNGTVALADPLVLKEIWLSVVKVPLADVMTADVELAELSSEAEAEETEAGCCEEIDDKTDDSEAEIDVSNKSCEHQYTFASPGPRMLADYREHRLVVNVYPHPRIAHLQVEATSLLSDTRCSTSSSA